MALGYQARGAMQVARARVVAQAAPKRENLAFVGGRERAERRKASDEALEIRQRRGDLRLLQHDLGEPDAVGVARVLPWQAAAAVASLPARDARREGRKSWKASSHGAARSVATFGPRGFRRSSPRSGARRAPLDAPTRWVGTFRTTWPRASASSSPVSRSKRRLPNPARRSAPATCRLRGLSRLLPAPWAKRTKPSAASGTSSIPCSSTWPEGTETPRAWAVAMSDSTAASH